MEINDELAQYQRVLQLRILGKRVQHLSYSFNSLERKYPLETIDPRYYEQFLSIYKNLYKEIDGILKDFEGIK